MAEVVTIDFDEAGEPTISVSGVPGKRCLDETAAAEAALGLTDVKRRETPEMRQRENRRGQLR